MKSLLILAILFVIIAGVPTSYTSLSISSVVPSNATTVSGLIGADANQGGGVAIAGDSNGVGEIIYAYRESNFGGTFEGFFECTSFSDLPLPTAQTLYYFANANTTHVRLMATAYTI